MRLREKDEQVTYMSSRAGDGPITLINVFNVAPEDAERLLEVWAEDAAFMKRQPGFVSTQLHRGTAGSSTFVNVAEWESARTDALSFSLRLVIAHAGAALRDRRGSCGGPVPSMPTGTCCRAPTTRSARMDAYPRDATAEPAGAPVETGEDAA